MANFGLGAEQFGIDAANWNIGIDSGNPFIVAAATDAIREQQEVSSHHAVEPEIMPVVEPVSQPVAKAVRRKYMKRSK